MYIMCFCVCVFHQVLDHELPIDHGGDFVHYDIIKLDDIRCKRNTSAL